MCSTEGGIIAGLISLGLTLSQVQRQLMIWRFDGVFENGQIHPLFAFLFRERLSDKERAKR